MKSKIRHTLILITIVAIFLSTFSTSAFSYEKTMAGDIGSLTFKQEIIIPIDTSLEQARYQPIDVRITFSEPCYVKDEIDNSVRVGYDTGCDTIELESQIYDLEHTDNTHISSCSVVFLTPSEANGKERYYIFYDSEETKPANYEKHVCIEDTHYFYEPIAGQKIYFDYYKITQDEEIIYALVQNGELLGNPVSQHIGKFKPGTKIVETYNIDQLAGFDMRYGINNQPGYYGTTWATEVTKSVLVEGNLMARMRISCKSPNSEIKTDNIYTYYYCPGEVKKITVNCHQEILKDINIENPEFYDGSYAGIVSIKARSATIEKMNVGEILPEINVYSEEEIIRTYEVPQNPDSAKREAVLSTEADIDLGSKAWISLSNPSTGKTHGLIMDSTTGISPDEEGVQVKAWVNQNLKLPGLDADTGNIFLMRNAYEKNAGHNTQLKKGFIASYNVEFISVEDNGEEIINAESDIFQTLSKNVAFNRGDETKEEDDKQRYQLKTIVHLAPSIPLGSLLSAALGKNVSYIYAELYKEDCFRSSGSIGRISLAGMDIDFEGKNLIEKLKTVVSLFDWKNASLFKKIVFPDIEPGRYIVKVFRENPLLAEERQFIGFSIVDVKEDTTSHIYCTLQGSIDILVVDQDEKPVEGVFFNLEYNEDLISNDISSISGTCLIHAPCKSSDKYLLKAFYNGFLVHEQPVKLGLVRHFRNYNILFSIDYYDLFLDVKDTWGFAPAVDVQPVLTSDDMIIPTVIKSEKTDSGKYVFNGLTPGDYRLSMSYKSFEKTEEIAIENHKKMDLIFPAEYNIDFNVLDAYAQSLSEGKMSIMRNGKQEQIYINEEGLASINVPPGNYELNVLTYDDEEIGKLNIQLRSDKTVELVTKKDSFIHTFALIVGFLMVIVSFYLAFIRKQRYSGLKLFVIAFILISIFMPWWVLNGDNGLVETNTKILVFPQKIVTVTSSAEIIGGEISQVPQEVTMALEILFMLLISVVIISLVSIFTKNRFKKTTKIFSSLSFVILLLIVMLFYLVISQLAEVGVGSIMGSGELDVNIPGGLESAMISCSWGPGIGFYITFFVVVLLAVLQVLKRKIIVFLEKNNV